MTEAVAVAVVGVGAMGRHHARVYSEHPEARLVGLFDTDASRCRRMAERYDCAAFEDLESMLGRVEALSLAVPTPSHHPVGLRCLDAGCDVLLEKPIALTLAEADDLVDAASRRSRILQVGHVERYNPAVRAVEPLVNRPAFIEIHRLGSFAPRGLEVDVFLDLMIHDIDIVQALTDSEIREIRAVGIPVLSSEIDIANARIELESGCIVNLTASRVSMNRVRKLRIFQPEAYFSVDYSRQEVAHFRLERDAEGAATISAHPVVVENAEPLGLEIDEFLASVRGRMAPRVDGRTGRRALAAALAVRAAVP